MPIIASQHKRKNSDHVPQDTWPDDCMVQWGDRGVVISAEGTRGTAFFEAFPKPEGFFRGEGKTIAEAEAAAFAKYTRFMACAEHAWSRRNYNNGGCFCRNCGVFMVVMHPVATLGEWKKPLSSFEIQLAMEGGLERYADSSVSSLRHDRRTWLRLRMFGIKLPPIPKDIAPELPPVTDENGITDYMPLTPYAKQCRDITCAWLNEKEAALASGAANMTTMSGFFDEMALRVVRHELQDWREEQLKKGSAA
jgi:hypothetical protein